MEVITIESKAFKALEEQIKAIKEFITTLQAPSGGDEDKWVDSYEVCEFLRISERTLQRLRSGAKISYTPLGGKYYYQISEIKRLLRERVIRSTEENLQNLIAHHKEYTQRSKAPKRK